MLVFLTPFFVIPTVWADINASKLLLATAVVAVALFAWLIARLSEGSVPVPRDPLLYLAAFLPIAYLISAVASKAPAESYVSGAGSQDTVVAMTILFALLALSALVLIAHYSARRALTMSILCVRGLLFGAVVVIILQMARLFFAFPWLSLGGVLSGNGSSVVGSWHDLGIFVALIVFLASALWSSPGVVRGYWRWALIALGVLSFFMLTVVSMQDVWYALAALMLVFAMYQWGSARYREGRGMGDAFFRGLVPILVGVAALGCGIGNSFLYTHLPKQLQIVQAEVRPSWQGTLSIGQSVFRGSGVIFGSGPNTFTRAWGEFKPPGVNQTQFWSTDFSTGVGLVPTSFVTAGMLGILAWLALATGLLIRMWRVAQQKRGAGTGALPVAVLAASLFLFAFHIMYTPGSALSILLFLLLGVSISVATADEYQAPRLLSLRSRRVTAAFGIGSMLLITLLIVGACVYSARAIASDLMVRKSAADYNSTGNLPHSLALVHQALVVYPDNDLAHRAAIELGLLQLQDMIAKGQNSNTTELQAALSRTIQEGLKAVSINSGDYQNWLALAQLYQSLGGVGVAGAYDNALSAYQRAAAENPTNPLPLIGASQVAAAQNDATSSLKYLNSAIALKNDLPAAYFLRSQIEGALGDFPAAIQDAKNAVYLAQQDPLGWYNLGLILYVSGDYATAAQALQQAISLNNSYANALFVFSLTADKLGRHQDAIAAMQEVVKLNPSDPTATQALANLQAEKPALTPPKSTSTPVRTR